MALAQRVVNRRAVVVAGIAGVVACAGAALPRLPASGRDPHVAGTPATASPVSTPGAEVPEIAIEAKGLRFSPSTVSIPANTPVRIVFTNPGRVYHDFVIPALGRRTPRVGPGESAELLITVEPGSYGFHCSIQSHHQAGMEGTITAT